MLCVAAIPSGPTQAIASSVVAKVKEMNPQDRGGVNVRLTCASRALHVRFAWSGVLWVPNSTVKSTVK